MWLCFLVGWSTFSKWIVVDDLIYPPWKHFWVDDFPFPKVEYLKLPGSYPNTVNYVVLSNMCYFHPYLGRWSNLTNIVQLDWNQQLVNLIKLNDHFPIRKTRTIYINCHSKNTTEVEYSSSLGALGWKGWRIRIFWWFFSYFWHPEVSFEKQLLSKLGRTQHFLSKCTQNSCDN